MADNIGEFTTTANSNTEIDSISVAEGWAPSAVNNAFRSLTAFLKQKDLDESGTITAAGTADIITITANQAISAYIDGLRVRAYAASDNTGAVTMNYDGVGAIKVQQNIAGTETACGPGAIKSGGLYEFVYDAALDSAAGGWWLMDLNSVWTSGTFTPEISDGVNEDCNYSTQFGSYTRVGDLVTFHINLTLTAFVSVGGNLQINGLPFTSANVAGQLGTAYFGYGNSMALSTAGDVPSGTIAANSSVITLRVWSATGGTSRLTSVELTNNATIMLSGSYKV